MSQPNTYMRASTRRRAPRPAVVLPKASIPYRFQYATHRDVAKMIKRKKQVGYLDTLPSSAVSVNSTGTFTRLTTIPQGDGQGQRVGDAVSVSGLRYHGLYKSNSLSAATTIHYLRVVFFRWLPDSNIEAPTLAKLFEVTTDNQTHFIGDRTARSKFQVLADYHQVFNSVNNGSGRPLVNIIKKYLKINKTLRFNEGLNEGKGHIYVLEWGNAASGNEDITANSDVRVFYKEQ